MAITDKQKFAAVLYFYIKQDVAIGKPFKLTDLSANPVQTLRGQYFPQPPLYRAICKRFPAMADTLVREGRKCSLTPKCEEMFAKLAGQGPVLLYQTMEKHRTLSIGRQAISNEKPVKFDTPPAVWDLVDTMVRLAGSPDARSWLSLIDRVKANDPVALVVHRFLTVHAGAAQ